MLEEHKHLAGEAWNTTHLGTSNIDTAARQEELADRLTEQTSAMEQAAMTIHVAAMEQAVEKEYEVTRNRKDEAIGKKKAMPDNVNRKQLKRKVAEANTREWEIEAELTKLCPENIDLKKND